MTHSTKEQKPQKAGLRWSTLLWESLWIATHWMASKTMLLQEIPSMCTDKFCELENENLFTIEIVLILQPFANKT